MWIRDTRCREVVESAWDLGGNLSSVQLIDKLRNCNEMLKSWNWREFGNVNLIIKQKRESSFNILSLSTTSMERKKKFSNGNWRLMKF